MDTKELTYPVFEANQVLSSTHLNELFAYLDEQTRLTRANLVGIGIVCGLEVSFEQPVGPVHLSSGCGVTSQGYLVVEPVDLTLTYVRAYRLPREVGYEPFMKAVSGGTPAQFDLWELFPDDDEPGTTSLADSGLMLDDKVVVLFVEQTKDRLRNCSPNNCNDRGAAVTSTVRRLLVDVADLDSADEIANQLAPSHLGPDLTERLELPDLRMPRVDVPNTGPVSSEGVLQAFQEVFRREGLVGQTAKALTALYEAFRLVVQDSFDDNPFLGFASRFDFLDEVPKTTVQVRFMQYYWDLFDDVLTAYDEVRWTGVDLLCACCPPEGLFPRHLMAGALVADLHGAAEHRHRFVRSPAVGDCLGRTRELQALFGRLVALVDRFTERPPDTGVRATPSRSGDAPLSAKAIPYYYDQTGTPPVYRLWDPLKSARGRANHNLGYRSGEYTPAAPAFVTDPLAFDLEPNDFLRIEGHLGKDVQDVLGSLLALKKSHRLPIEVVALRTGTFDEKVEIDLSAQTCRFRDLETLYGSLRAELVCFLAKEGEYFQSLAAGGGGKAPSTELQDQLKALDGALSAVRSAVAGDIRQVDAATLVESDRELDGIARKLAEASRREGYDPAGLTDRLDDITFRCRVDPLVAVADEYRRRLGEAKRDTFLGHYLEQHPGVQHKAGVPLGGTFILAYHEQPVMSVTLPDAGVVAAEAQVEGVVGPAAGLERTRALDEGAEEQLATALARMPYKADLAEDPDVQLLYTAMTGEVLVPKRPGSSTEQIYLDAVAGLPRGAVIADFFLPYQCCSDCTPIQYQLPPVRPRVSASPACTDAEGLSDVALNVEGASGSLMVQVDDMHFQELAGGSVSLQTGDHTIVVRDATGAESSPVDISVPAPMVVSGAEKSVDEAAGTYQVVAQLRGGTPPYTSDVGTIADSTFTSEPVPVADPLTIVVKDAAGCSVVDTHEGVSPCDLPGGGAAVRQGFRFWIPEARPNLPVKDVSIEPLAFAVVGPSGVSEDLTDRVAGILQRSPKDAIRTADFSSLVQRWLDGINDEVSHAVGSDLWLRLEYEPPTEPDVSGALFADRLDAVDLRFSLRVSYTQGGAPQAFELAYSSSGTNITESRTGSAVHIPPFRESTSNKCRPEEPPVLRCESTDLVLAITRSVEAERLVLSASCSGHDIPVGYVWELQDGVPSIADGETIRPTFQPTEPVDKLVRLTAFTANSCQVVVEDTISTTLDGG